MSFFWKPCTVKFAFALEWHLITQLITWFHMWSNFRSASQPNLRMITTACTWNSGWWKEDYTFAEASVDRIKSSLSDNFCEFYIQLMYCFYLINNARLQSSIKKSNLYISFGPQVGFRKQDTIQILQIWVKNESKNPWLISNKVAILFSNMHLPAYLHSYDGVTSDKAIMGQL